MCTFGLYYLLPTKRTLKMFQSHCITDMTRKKLSEMKKLEQKKLKR